MKTIIMMIALMMCLVFATSCSKEKGCMDKNATNFSYSAEESDGSCVYPPPPPPAPTQCNCGLITDDGFGSGLYWVYIQNSCTGNIAMFYLSYNDWMNAYVGNNLCISNSSGWRTITVPGNVTPEMIKAKNS